MQLNRRRFLPSELSRFDSDNSRVVLPLPFRSFPVSLARRDREYTEQVRGPSPRIPGMLFRNVHDNFAESGPRASC
jgi:hypothetical protein